MQEITIEPAVVEGCRQRLRASQEIVYKQTYVPFLRICLRYTGNYEDAVNVLQDAFLKVFTKVEGYSGKGSFVGWMKRIVVNTAIDFVRKQKQDALVPIEHVGEVAEMENDDPKEFVDEKNLLEAISALPAMQKLVFNLYVMEECSHQKIAERLSISVATSKWYLFDARKILQKKLAVYLHA